jgi:8-oxo-dGTP pyrophosphatase MutT (NUDIX family)
LDALSTGSMISEWQRGEDYADRGMFPNRVAAAIVFVNREGELLLSLREDAPDLIFPAHWEVIEGTGEAGEVSEETAVRKAWEAIGERDD